MDNHQTTNPKPAVGWSISRPLVYGFIFFSGLAGLIYELLWIRLLNLTFGVSSFAIATVFGMFLLGLGLGGVYFGKKSEQTASPLRLYAWLEFNVAMLSALAFYILQHTTLFDWLLSYSYNNLSLYGHSLITVLAAGVILLPSTIAMGGTVPVMSKYFITSNRRLGSQFSTLYYVNTIGAVVGTLLTGLLLIQWLGTIITFILAMGINLLIAGWLFLFHKKNTSSSPAEPIETSPLPASSPRRSMLLVLFLTGFATLGFELVWIRVLTNFGSGTTLSFTLILSGFLLGFVGGSIYLARIIDRLKNLTGHFSIYAGVAGVGGALTLFVFSRLNNYLSQQFLSYLTLLTESWIGFGLSFLIALALGTLFPLGVRLYAGSKTHIGHKTGLAYIANMLGAICGSLLVGFVFIPRLGIKPSTTLLIGICLLVSIYMLFQSVKNKRTIVMIGSCIIITATLVIFSENTFYRSPAGDQLLYYAEGLSATVTVYREGDFRPEQKYMNIDSQTVAGTYPTGIIDAKLLAHLPLLLADNIEHVATIGYGTGITSYSMSLYNTSVTALEIEQKVIEAARQEFPEVNHRVDTNPNVNITIDDARNYLHHTDQRFGVIVTDVTNLKYKTNPYLYTTDYFQIIKNRLTPDGLAAAWVPLGGLSARDLRTLAASFQSVFPHTTIWYYAIEPTGFLIFVGTPNKLVVDITTITKKIEPVAEDLKSLKITDAYTFSSLLLMGEQDVRNFTANAILHTDDRPILEFTDLDYYATANPLENLSILFNNQKEILRPYFNFPDSQEQTLLDALGISRANINYYLGNY